MKNNPSSHKALSASSSPLTGAAGPVETAHALLDGDAIPAELVVHGQDVANLLLRWGAGETLVAAALVHEIVYQGFVRVADVGAVCGADVAALCAQYRTRFAAEAPPGWRGKPAALQRVRFYAAAHADTALALLCIAHLWHSAAYVFAANARPLNTSLALQRADIRTILIPALEMMGMRELLDQLDANPHVSPREPMTQADRLLLDHICDEVGKVARGAGSRGRLQISGREGPFATYERMSAAERLGERIYQYPGFHLQIVVPTVADCYGVLYRLHSHFRPLEGTVFDTISYSRANGHRSLQASIKMNAQGRFVRVNVQIVTPEMDAVNRWGVAVFAIADLAAHYHLPKPLEMAPFAGCWWNRPREIVAAIQAAPAGSAQADPIVAFSPQGEPFVFERGASVVDYAYHVHSYLAEQVERFLVNGESVEPATIMRHLDLVEMEHDPRAAGPTMVWLNAARTKRARSLIRRFLRRQSEGAGQGRRILETRLAELEEYYGFHIPEHRVEDALTRGARTLGLPSQEEVLNEFALGRVAVDRYLHPLFAEEIVRRVELPRTMRLRPHQIHLAQCCKPRPGDDIVGLPYKRAGVLTRITIHNRNCQRFKIIPSAVSAEAVDLRWRLRAESRLLAHIDMVARDDDRLLGAALQEFYAFLPRIELLHSDATARRGTARLRFSFEADSPETVEEIADALRRLPNREVSAVRLLSLPPSEQEALHAEGSGSDNPYTRMPVHDPTMFFGRTAELDRLNEWLRNNVTCIWLRGQKRVGKTSLLLHLRHHYWEPHETVCAFVDFQLLSNLASANIFYEIASAVYNDLNKDPRIVLLGPPERSHFEQDAPQRLIQFLRDVQQRLATRRLVVLMDEFSRVTDLYLQGALSADFFQQWRGLLQATKRHCAFVTVVQQKTYEHMAQLMRTNPGDPAWHVLELGETVHLRPFGEADARRLIEWPMRNYMEFDPGASAAIMQLTGGSPFLIQAFCNKLMAQLARRNSGQVEMDDIETVAEEFMQPAESIFAHLLDMAHGVADTVLTQMAMQIEGEGAEVGASVNRGLTNGASANGTWNGTPLAGGSSDRELLSWQQIVALLPSLPEHSLRGALMRLRDSDILTESTPGAWRFNSTLFRRWLARNPWDGAEHPE